MEQDFKPALYLQVLREFADLTIQYGLNGELIEIFGSHQIEKFNEVLEWGNEVKEFIGEVKPEIIDESVEKNSFWGNNMISRIRKLRAKRLNFTFQRASDVGSSSTNMAPPSLREELCFQITLLAIVVLYKMLAFTIENGDLEGEEEEEVKLNSHFMDEQRKLINSFLLEIQPQLQGKIPEENSDWYRRNIAKARTLIDKWEPRFCFQSQHVESFSINLHEELVCQVRSLILMTYVDSAQSHKMPHDPHEFKKQLEEWGNEVAKFVRRIILQLQEEIPERNSDWYLNKIAESRTLTAKRYSAFPLQSQSQYLGSLSSSINIPAVELKELADDVDCSKEIGQLFLAEQDTHNKVNIPTVESKAHVDDVGYSKERYQIFLSFRGEDTRYSFTGFLYKALCEKGFKVFMDDRELHKGDPVAEVIMGAIENSKLSIIVFSQNFAESTWCLDEVVKILDCKEKKKQLVWPVFYKVEPSDVRHQKNNYGKAMTKQERRFGKDCEMVINWKSALRKVSNFNAFHYKKNSGYESEFIQSILNEVTTDIRDRLQAWI